MYVNSDQIVIIISKIEIAVLQLRLKFFTIYFKRLKMYANKILNYIQNRSRRNCCN